MLLAIQDTLFTADSIGTLAGATLAVVIICNTIQNIFNFSPKWLALVVSFIISIIAASITVPANKVSSADSTKTDSLHQAAAKPTKPREDSIPMQPAAKFGKYVLAVLNGFLIYASATGANQIVGSTHPPSNNPQPPANPPLQPIAQKRATAKRKFSARWWS